METGPLSLDAKSLMRLVEASGMINASLDIDVILPRIIDTAMAIAECEGCSLMLRDPLSGELVFRISDNSVLNESKERIVLKPGVGVCGAVAQTGQPLLVADTRADERFFPGVDEQTGVQTRSILALPMLRGQDVVGVLEVINPKGREAFTQNDIPPLMLLANLSTIALSNAQRLDEVEREAEGLRRQAPNVTPDDFVGSSETTQNMLQVVRKASQSPATVLIRGESGVGKEMVARLLHRWSDRAKKPLVAINCGALPENLLESELFGHEKGAFTGAHQRKIGRFELAHGGTLFLDEIGELAPSLQVKLLRVLQERSFERLGGLETIQVDVRIIAATNRNLEMSVTQENFREDLYYRLNVIPIEIPPLRQRREEIPDLAEHFLKISNRRLNRKLTGFTPEAMAALRAAQWRGNIRELENCIERVAVLCDGPKVMLTDLPDDLRPDARGASGSTGGDGEGGGSLYDYEKRLMVDALEACNWNVSAAARRLQIPRHHLRYRMQKFDISRD